MKEEELKKEFEEFIKKHGEHSFKVRGCYIDCTEKNKHIDKRICNLQLFECCNEICCEPLRG